MIGGGRVELSKAEPERFTLINVYQLAPGAETCTTPLPMLCP